MFKAGVLELMGAVVDEPRDGLIGEPGRRSCKGKAGSLTDGGTITASVSIGKLSGYMV